MGEGSNTISSAATAPRPSEQATRRREALAVHVEQIEEIQRSGSDLEESLAGIELDSWELDQLDRGPGDESCPWSSLITQGVAFRIKCLTDLGWGPEAQQLSIEELNDFRELLIADAAIGIALLEESQQAINHLIGSGEMDVVKKLAAFRNRISRSVNELKGKIGERGFDEAMAASEELTTPVDRAAWTERETREAAATPAAATPAASRPAPGRVTFKEEREAASNHLKPLLMLLGLAVVVWGVFVLPKLTVRTVQTLTVSDVSPRSEIRHVVAKPPSLYVELNASSWRALDGQQRLELMDDVGRTAAAAGYNGAHFTLENGATAGQWLKEQGSRLAD